MTFRGLDATLLSSHPGERCRIVRVTVSTDEGVSTMDLQFTDAELEDVSSVIREVAMTATEGE